MGPTQSDTDPRQALADRQARRRLWFGVAPLVAVMVVFALAAVLFGGPVFGGLTMHDLEGRSYTVTSVRLDGFVAVDDQRTAPTITFGDGRVTWSAGCNLVSSQYRIVWTTLETSGPAVSTAMGCDPFGQARDAAFGAFMNGQPEIHNHDNNRVLMSGPAGSLELLERS